MDTELIGRDLLKSLQLEQAVSLESLAFRVFIVEARGMPSFDTLRLLAADGTASDEPLLLDAAGPTIAAPIELQSTPVFGFSYGLVTPVDFDGLMEFAVWVEISLPESAGAGPYVYREKHTMAVQLGVGE